ncbi:outer membrane protein [Sphingomonas naasensis]|uniref:MipA/OmpV family protein n=1 Tax=Sphingomonas naasensis TaxID=1344951 RepID=A0A4S1WRV0_9SPHN|nr:MipA/OmpV family protein [Sphingomonas naasensis]NIJ18909.1 outer membrane protein [Sphingomonas naasensis]TGX46128.1 MipA/OmpV family protein [Sphingomonas naasensis]
MIKALLAVAALPALVVATGAAAQEADPTATSPSLVDSPAVEKETRRARVALGPQIRPRFPGSDRNLLLPLYDVSVTRGDKPFTFEAADQGVSIAIVQKDGFAFGPSFRVEGSRRRSEADLPVDEVGTSFEAGGYGELWIGSSIRARGELRKGVTGHKGLVSDVMLDYVARDGDKWLFSVGPRFVLADRKYQEAYFGVNPAASARTGLAVYRPDGGIHSVGASATTLFQLDRSWGVYGYVKYERLIADAADSPIVRSIGSRDQFSGGAALTFTFNTGIR